MIIILPFSSIMKLTPFSVITPLSDSTISYVISQGNGVVVGVCVKVGVLVIVGVMVGVNEFVGVIVGVIVGVGVGPNTITPIPK